MAVSMSFEDMLNYNMAVNMSFEDMLNYNMSKHVI